MINAGVSDALLFSNIISEADFILVVEKDTTFQKLMDENFQAMFPRGILATSKGYPDIATRNVLKMLSEKRKFPIYGLFDADPHGEFLIKDLKNNYIKNSNT